VKAEELLERAQVAQANMANSERSYHVVRVAHSPGNTLAEHQRTEMWFADSEHFRMETRAHDPTSGITGRLIHGVVRNGDEYWTFVEDGPAFGAEQRTMHVKHGRAEDYPFARHAWALEPDLDAAMDLLQREGCAEAEVAGSETVAGRSALVVEVVPASGCTHEAITVWVDQESLLTLRAVREGDDGVARRSDVVALELDVSFTYDTFSYVAPPGSVVTDAVSR
jgi:hypothetical protein